MRFLRNIKLAIGRNFPTKVINTNYLEIYDFDGTLKNGFQKIMTWKLFSDRIESKDRFGIKVTLRLGLIKHESAIPDVLAFRVHPDDVKDGGSDKFTITKNKVEVNNSSKREYLIFKNK